MVIEIITSSSVMLIGIYLVVAKGHKFDFIVMMEPLNMAFAIMNAGMQFGYFFTESVNVSEKIVKIIAVACWLVAAIFHGIVLYKGIKRKRAEKQQVEKTQMTLFSRY